jgi:hypothetical protein
MQGCESRQNLLGCGGARSTGKPDVLLYIPPKRNARARTNVLSRFLNGSIHTCQRHSTRPQKVKTGFFQKSMKKSRWGRGLKSWPPVPESHFGKNLSKTCGQAVLRIWRTSTPVTFAKRGWVTRHRWPKSTIDRSQKVTLKKRRKNCPTIRWQKTWMSI